MLQRQNFLLEGETLRIRLLSIGSVLGSLCLAIYERDALFEKAIPEPIWAPDPPDLTQG